MVCTLPSTLPLFLLTVLAEAKVLTDPQHVDNQLTPDEEIPNPSYLLYSVHEPSSQEVQTDRLSRTILALNEEIISFSPRDSSTGQSVDERMQHLRDLPPDQVSAVLRDQGLAVPEHSQIVCDSNSVFYRTLDGSCNNLKRPCWGKAGEPYRRWLQPAYSDGINLPRRKANNDPLPNPRNVYLWVSSQKDQSSETEHPSLSSLAVVWGQAVAHDVLLTPTVTIKMQDRNARGGFVNTAPSCCDPRHARNPECAAVVLEEEDGFYQRGHCMDIPRSAAFAMGPDTCSPVQLGHPREQINQLTAYLDASLVYGTTEHQMRSLREDHGRGAKLLMEQSHSWSYPPRQNNSVCKAMLRVCDKRCFNVGEKRANENPILGAIHTMWAREHNRLVDEFSPRGWTQETLFHVVRKIIGALMQHITYNEYLPEIFGPNLVEWLNLKVPTQNYAYDPEVNPTIFNSFAAAAFRFGHSQVSTRYQRQGRSYAASPLLSADFFSMDEFCGPTHGDPVAYLVEGQLVQSAQKVDHVFSAQVTNHLFAKHVNGSGLDLFSINVQRGRDHGLPPYTRWREACGLSAIHDYAQLKGFMPDDVIARLSTIYGPGGVNEIDLFVGGVSEFPVNGGILGPTFTCIVSNQFRNLKFGDRFWYENVAPNNPGGFTAEQIREIQKTTIASLFCRNSDLKEIQPNAFKIPSRSNPKIPCKDIERHTNLDISFWP